MSNSSNIYAVSATGTVAGESVDGGGWLVQFEQPVKCETERVIKYYSDPAGLIIPQGEVDRYNSSGVKEKAHASPAEAELRKANFIKVGDQATVSIEFSAQYPGGRISALKNLARGNALSARNPLGQMRLPFSTPAFAF